MPMTKRFTVPQLMRPFAWIAAGAFLLAANYCICEAFSSDAHEEASHQHAPAGHHDEQAPASHTQSDPCCAAMQAATTPKVDFQLASSPAWQLQPLVLESSWITALLEPSRTASGLSPSAREPTPTRPFYRTTYANHAPPVRLA